MAKSRTDTESVLKLVIDGKQANNSVKELKDTYIKLNTELNNMKKTVNPKAYAEKVANVRKVEQAWKDAREEIKGTTKEAVGFKDQLKDLAKSAAGGLFGAGAIYGLINGAKTMIQKNAELSDSFAGVMKTTGLGEEAVDRLNEKFKLMDTRTANTKLLELAQVAGKLGYSAEKDVEGFVRAADKIGVALGEDLGGVEESVNSLGKLVNIFKISDQFELEESLLKVGSAINTLGASGTANEKNLIDFSQRLAGVAPAANISLPTVLAYGAVMDELGQSMESSSTAIGQFIVELGADVPKYAKIAGMSIKDFSKLLKEDANEAFLRVLERSKSANGGLEALARNMGILEISGARGIAALGSMADNIGLVRSRLQTANDSFDEGTSILNEFDTVNNNLAANLEKLWNKLNQLWENSSVRSALTSLTSATISFVDWLFVADNTVENLNKSYQKHKEYTQALETQTDSLTKRYIELTAKSSLNKDEQEDLRKVIDQIAAILPMAVSEWGEYGDALDINIDKVRSLTKAQRTLFEARESGNIRDMQNQFRSSKQMAKIWQDQALEAQKNIETGNLSRMSKWFGLDEKDMKVGLKQSTLEMGKAYDAAKSLRDVYHQELTREQQAVIDHFDGIAKSAEKANKKVDENAGKETGTPSKTKKSGGAGKSDSDRKKEELKRKEDQAKKHFEQLLKDEALFAVQKEINQKEKNDREIAQLQQDYQVKIDKFKDFLTMEGALEKEKENAKVKIADLEKQRDNDVSQLKLNHEKEFVKNIQDIRTDLANKLESEYVREKAIINKKYDEQIKIVGSNENQVADIELARAAALTDAKIREEERLAKVKEQLENESEAFATDKWQSKINQVKRKYDEEIALLKEKNSKEIQESEAFKEVLKAYETNKENEILEIKRQKHEEQKDLAIGVAQSISDAVFSIISNNIQAESDARISAIEKQRERELANKNLSEKQKQAIQEKYDKQIATEKLRAWKAQKKADILQATINTALAVTKALPNWILAAAAGVAGAAQIAVIAAQKPPQFARGGFIPKGSSHAQGGINLIDSRTGSVVGNVEGDEPILSKSTYNNNRQIVDALLYSSQRMNGSRIQLRSDLISAEQTVRANSNSEAPVVNVNSPGTDNSEVIALLKQLVDKKEKPNKVVLSNRLLQEFNDEVIQLENRVNG